VWFYELCRFLKMYLWWVPEYRTFVSTFFDGSLNVSTSRIVLAQHKHLFITEIFTYFSIFQYYSKMWYLFLQSLHSLVLIEFLNKMSLTSENESKNISVLSQPGATQFSLISYSFLYSFLNIKISCTLPGNVININKFPIISPICSLS